MAMPPPSPQVSVGTGVKAGINIWRAVRDVKEAHPAWQHLQGKGITEADLPMPLSGGGGKDDMAEAEDMTASMEAMADNVMPGEYTATGTRAAAAAVAADGKVDGDRKGKGKGAARIQLTASAVH